MVDFANGASLVQSAWAGLPAELWPGWIDGDGELVAMTGLSVSRDHFDSDGSATVNVLDVDLGLAPEGIGDVAALGLFSALSDGDLVWPPIAVTFAQTPSEGDPLTARAGDLLSEYVAP